MYRYPLILLFLLTALHSIGQESFSVCSWNLQNLGRSKSDASIEYMASKLKNYDIVLIQEVVAKDYAGAQAVGRLGEALKRTGNNWEYRVSDISSGENSYKQERYAFLWKPSKAKLLGKPWLEKQYHAEIDREPFFASFLIDTDTVTLVNFHAITKASQPETEVKYFKFLPAEYPDLNLLFCGDFNLPQTHTVFNPLKKMGYLPSLVGQKTTLKKECIEEECLFSEFDNMFYNSNRIQLKSSGVIHFYKDFSSMQEAGAISDHAPITAEFILK